MKLAGKHILIFHKEPSVSKSFFNLVSRLLAEDSIVQVISRSAHDPLQVCSSNKSSNFMARELLRLKEMGAFGWSSRQKISLSSLSYHWIIVWNACAGDAETVYSLEKVVEVGEQAAMTWERELVAACSLDRRFLSFNRADAPSDIELEPYYCQDFTNNIQSRVSLPLLVIPEDDNRSPALESSIEVDQEREETSSNSSLSDDDSCTTLTETPSSILDHHDQEQESRRKGVLYLVGVGPGSPDLLTLRAHKLIHSCPVIVSDRLICTDIYKCLPPSTKLLFSRKVCGKANAAQDEINRWILENLNAGLDVVRAKGGDPFVFGRGGEEWNLATLAGFQVKWVPGISSSIAAAGAAGIPVTHRGVADSFVVATGQLQDGKSGTIPIYSSKRTLVLLMAVGVLDSLDSILRDLEYPRNCPVAVVHRATWPDQRIVRGQLSTIAQKVKDAGISSHAAIIVGNTVNALTVDSNSTSSIKEPVIEIEAHCSVGDALELLQQKTISTLAVVGAPGHYYSSNSFHSVHNGKQYIGLVMLADIVSFLLSRPDNTIEKSILSVLGATNESLSLWILKDQDSLLSSLEPLCKGVHSFLVATADFEEPLYLLSQLDVLGFLHAQWGTDGGGRLSFELSSISLDSVLKGHLDKDVVVASLDDSVKKTLEIMSEHEYRSVGVVDKAGCLVDYFSFTDLKSLLVWTVREHLLNAISLLSATSMESFLDASRGGVSMKTGVFLLPTASVQDAVEAALDGRVHHVWIVEDIVKHLRKPIGVVSLTDLIGVIRST